jgi:dinuclear metal center YbgI/SA1388 family protein
MGAMPTVADVLQSIDTIAPFRSAFQFDHVGLEVGDPSRAVSCALVTLDRSLEAIRFGQKIGANLVVAHHPLFFEPESSMTSQTMVGETALVLAESNTALIAAHTNWDAAIGGVSDALAQTLELEEIRPAGSATMDTVRKIVVFVPTDHTEIVLDAMAEAGAGQIGPYRRCAFMSRGTGTFQPLSGANPSIGSVGKIETVEEDRIEVVVAVKNLPQVLRALHDQHPYETPAYDILATEAVSFTPVGRIGKLKSPRSLREWIQDVNRSLNTSSLAWGDPEIMISKVFVAGGAADSEWQAAKREQADAFLTGEIRQNRALEMSHAGIVGIAAGHYATEQPGVIALANRLAELHPDVRWHVYEPEPGLGGRPLYA